MGETRHRHLLTLALALALAAVLYQSYRFVPQAFLTLGRLAFLAAQAVVITAALSGWGALVLRGLGARAPLAPAAVWAAGAALAATLAGWLAPLWFPDLRLWGPWLLAGALLAWRDRQAVAWRRLVPRDSLLLCALPFGLAALVLALAPPTSLDGLVYHLALPKQYALAGRMFPTPWSVHSYFPLHVEMLYGLALTLDGTGRLAQLLHLTAALAAVSAASDLARRYGARAGAWAAIVLYTLPVLTLISGWAWSDWFVILYAALALAGILDLRAGGEESRGVALPTLLFAAAAAAVKYAALPLLALPALALGRLRRAQLVAGAALALALLGPWYGRNLLLTGNPVHPLLSGSSRLGSLVGFRGGESGLDKWLGYLGRPDLLDESLGALLAAGLVAGIAWTARNWRRAWPLAAVAGVYLAVALVHHPTVRTFTPLMLVAAVAVGAGLAELWTRGPRPLLVAALTLVLWINFAQVLWVVREHRPSGVALGYQKVESYLEQELDVYPALRWINDNAPPGAGVLVVGDSRIFHLDRPAVAGSYLDPHPLRGFLRPDEELPALAARLRAAGIHYLLLNAPHYRVGAERRLRDELTFFADPETDAVFRALLAELAQPVHRERGVGIWRLPAAGERNQPSP